MNGTRLLEGKIALVTGCGRGIGRAIAQRFAEEGAVVYANDVVSGSVDAWLGELPADLPGTIIPSYFNITDSVAVKETLAGIRKQQSRIDVLVNNAGIVTYEFMSLITKDNLRAMFDVNVFAMIDLIQMVSRVMARNKSGSIINMSSIVGVNGVGGQLAYSASKGAVVSITKSAAKELAAANIRVNALAPGMVATERLKQVMEDNFSDKVSNIGFGRLAEPEEIANACVFLASDLSSYISGQIIGVDGCTVL